MNSPIIDAHLDGPDASFADYVPAELARQIEHRLHEATDIIRLCQSAMKANENTKAGSKIMNSAWLKARAFIKENPEL